MNVLQRYIKEGASVGPVVYINPVVDDIESHLDLMTLSPERAERAARLDAQEQRGEISFEELMQGVRALKVEQYRSR